jgi:hypothetical protein
VTLFRDKDVASVYTVHSVLERDALLFRAGGYWWDGSTWYRPNQVWDAASETYYRRKVPAASTVTAADMLTGRAVNAEGARILPIEEVDPDSGLEGQWLDHLALWGRRRGNSVSLPASVVSLSAPELSVSQMVAAAEVAGIVGIAASTLRAYVSRGEADVPLPQAVVNGHSMWSVPVAEEWAEQRRRSDDGVTEAVSAGRAEKMPPGTAEIQDQLGRSFFARLWENPATRKRWALRWRTEGAVREIAEGLSWDVAASLDRIVPVDALASTIMHAFIDEFREGQELSQSNREFAKQRGVTEDHDDIFYGVIPDVARMLDWLIRHDPARAAHVIATIIGEAERRLNISREVSENSLRTALALDGKLDREARNEFLNRVFTPATEINE